MAENKKSFFHFYKLTLVILAIVYCVLLVFSHLAFKIPFSDWKLYFSPFAIVLGIFIYGFIKFVTGTYEMEKTRKKKDGGISNWGIAVTLFVLLVCVYAVGLIIMYATMGFSFSSWKIHIVPALLVALIIVYLSINYYLGERKIRKEKTSSSYYAS